MYTDTSDSSSETNSTNTNTHTNTNTGSTSSNDVFHSCSCSRSFTSDTRAFTPLLYVVAFIVITVGLIIAATVAITFFVPAEHVENFEERLEQFNAEYDPTDNVAPSGFERVLVDSDKVVDAHENMNGSGTEQDPYVVTDVIELQSMQLDLDAYYELGNDINASETEGWNDPQDDVLDAADAGVVAGVLTESTGFAPIGDIEDDAFTGSFDGNGYAITGLTIDRPSESLTGLFGEVQGDVADVWLEDASVHSQYYSGAVAGIVRHPGTVDSVVVHESDVSAHLERAGGVAGENSGTVTQSWVQYSSVESGKYVGGVTARNTGVVNGVYMDSSVQSYVTGAMANGNSIVGDQDGEFEDDEEARFVGGVVGENHGVVDVVYFAENASVSGVAVVGGVVGFNGDGEHAMVNTSSVSGVENVTYSPYCPEISCTVANEPRVHGTVIGFDAGTGESVEPIQYTRFGADHGNISGDLGNTIDRTIFSDERDIS